MVEIGPIRVEVPDQPDLPISSPFLQRFLTRDCIENGLAGLVPDETVYVAGLGGAGVLLDVFGKPIPPFRIVLRGCGRQIRLEVNVVMRA